MSMGQKKRSATVSGKMSASNSVREVQKKECLKISGQIIMVFLRPIKSLEVRESFFQETQNQKKIAEIQAPALLLVMDA